MNIGECVSVKAPVNRGQEADSVRSESQPLLTPPAASSPVKSASGNIRNRRGRILINYWTVQKDREGKNGSTYIKEYLILE